MFFFNGSETSRELTPIYSWWASVMILQLLSFSWFTGRSRVIHETIHSEEDRMWLKNINVKLRPNGHGHREVEYLRTGHFKELAVTIPYLLITPIWLNSDPCRLSAKILLRLFPISRIFGTLLYMKFVTAPKICTHFVRIISYIVLVYISIANVLLCINIPMYS